MAGYDYRYHWCVANDTRTRRGMADSNRLLWVLCLHFSRCEAVRDDVFANHLHRNFCLWLV